MKWFNSPEKITIAGDHRNPMMDVLWLVFGILSLFFAEAIFAAAPVANDDTVTTTEDTAVTINVLANDTDADGDALSILTAVASANGTTTNNGSTITFTPDADFAGTVSIFYFAQDLEIF